MILSKKTPALYLTNPANIQYLTNFRGSHGTALLTKKYLYLFTDKRYLNEAQTNCKKAKFLHQRLKVLNLEKNFDEQLAKILKNEKIKTLGFESQNIKYQQYLWLNKNLKPGKIHLNATTNLIENIRSVKNRLEIKSIIKAQRIAEKVLQEIKNHLTEGIKETELAWKIEYLGRFFGAEGVSFPPLVCFGASSAVPHHEPNHTQLKTGDIILLDFGFKINGYCSDMTRVFFTQTPSKQQIKVYKTLLKAQKEAIDNLRPGMTGETADSFGRNVIKAAKFGDYFTHSLGHGVGLDIHELPNLSPKPACRQAGSKKKPDIKLEKNMIITIEPGIYLDQKFGIRLEDMILIGGKKNLNLTKAPKRLEDAIIKR